MSSSTESYPDVGFIGLGAMGFAMSTHLVRMGFPVVGYDIYGPTLDRWTATCKDIPNARASVATSPAETVKNATVVCLMVANHYHVHSALFDGEGAAIKALPKGCLVIIQSTIPPTQPSEIKKRLVQEFGREDIRLIDAPVSGGAARSVDGTLTIMSSSDDPANLEDTNVKLVLENLATKGKTLFAIPGGLGNGESAKALNQVMCGIHIPAASEIMGLAAVTGLDTKAFYETLIATDSNGTHHRGWTWMLENRGPRILSANPPMASAISIINKDVGIIRDEETRLGVELPLLNRASEIITQVMQTHAAADDCCIVQNYLGFGSPREHLVVEQAGKTSVKNASEQINALAWAHAVINLNSAFETVKFAQSLNLMGDIQKKRWFSIISGAAGGSTTFSEVIPLAFADPKGIEAAFEKYAKEKFANVVEPTVSSPYFSKLRQ